MDIKVLKSLVIIGLALVVTLTACNFNKPQTKQKDQDNTTTIVTSFYPMYILTKNITKDIPDVEVINLTPPQTGCLHDYQATTSDLKTLEKADFFVINGAGMEAFMDKIIKQYPNLKIIEASKGLELIKDETTGDINPHVWVGISGAIGEVKNIGQQLAQFDSKHSEQYRVNMNNFAAKLESLKDKMHSKIDAITNKDIVTFHEAFPYFAKEFGLNIVSVIEREPGSEPSAAETAKTIEIVKKANVKALFAEPQYSAQSAQTISSETGAKLYTLDPVVNGPDNPDAYINLMEKNLETLSEALK